MKTLTHKQQRILDQLEREGFDQSCASESGGCKVRCSQCEACCINDVACHETGCPNAPRPECEEDNDW